MIDFRARQTRATYLMMAVLIIIQFTAFAQDSNTREWKLAKNKNGIKIYTRLMSDGKFKEYKVETVISATPDELIDVLLDVEDYTQWMAFVKEARILESDGKKSFYVYSEVNVPWPFDNRDEVTLTKVHREEGSDVITIDVEIIPDYIPEKKKVVRMPSGKGKWIFTPVGEGKTELVHCFGGDPGGNIPAWIVNMFLVDGPYKTMLGLQQKVLEE